MNILGLFAGWLWLLAQIAAAGATVQVEYRDSPWSRIINGQPTAVVGEVWCLGRDSSMILLRTASPDIVVHEYAHAWDCADNGRMDASPLPDDADISTVPPGHCRENLLETYACWYTNRAAQ